MRLISVNEFEQLREKDFKNLVVVNDEETDMNYFILVDDNERSHKGTDFIDFLRKERCFLNARINVRYYYLQEYKDEE